MASGFIGLSVTDRGKATSANVKMVFLSNDPDEHHQFVLVSGRPDNVNFHLNQQFLFLGDRQKIRLDTVEAALNLMLHQVE